MLSREVELQLQELLDNRPNEEKAPIRYRNKRKDIIKNAKRGDGYNLIHSIVNKRMEEELLKHPPLLDKRSVLLKISQIEDYVYTESNERMFSREELDERFEGYIVTQNQSPFTDKVQLVARKCRWGINLADDIHYIPHIRMNTVVIEGKEGNMDCLNRLTFRLDDVYEVLAGHLSKSDIEYVYNVFYQKAYTELLNEKRNTLKSNPSNIISKDEYQTLQLVLKYQRQSNWIKKKFVERKKSTLRNYIYNQLRNNGDYGLLHNNVDLFEVEYFVY